MTSAKNGQVVRLPTRPKPADDGSAEAIEVSRETAEIEVIGATGEPLGADVAMAVDPPSQHYSLVQLTGLDLPERRIIVPLWMRSWANLRSVTAWLVRYSLHVGTYHLTRSPKYLAKALWRGLVGAWRVTQVWWAWFVDTEGRQVARAAYDARELARWTSARKEWHETKRRRQLITVLCAFVGGLFVGAAWLWAPSQVVALALCAVLFVLVRLGVPDDGSGLLDEVVSVGAQPFRLTSKMIVTALGALGLAGINAAIKADAQDAIRFPAPIREDGPGFKATVDLPHGVTAAMVMEKRTNLASGLRRPLGCVWPESVPDVHAGRLVIWVGHHEMAKMTPPKPPYAKESWRGDAFAEQPFGFDQRKRPIEFELMYGNMLIGSLPGAGKTATIRGLMLALALDPTVEMRISEHKGSGDLSMFEQMAHFYVSGVTDEDIAATVQMLREVLREVDRRAKVVKKLGQTTNLAPESKVTRQIANDRRLGLHPLLVVVDECHEVFGHERYGAEAGKLAERIIRRGRAFGVISIWATQRPDSDALPTGVSGNVSIRFCLRVMGQVENDMILGTSSYRHGIQATTLTPRDRGVGYLKGAFDDAVVVRSHYQDKPAAERIAKRAFGLREAGGYLTGMAAGEEAERGPSYSLLDDLGTIFVTCERGMHSETVCDKLRELRPDAYADWTPHTLAAALPEGLSTGQVWSEGRNAKGLKRADVLAAIEGRDVPQLGQDTS